MGNDVNSLCWKRIDMYMYVPSPLVCRSEGGFVIFYLSFYNQRIILGMEEALAEYSFIIISMPSKVISVLC